MVIGKGVEYALHCLSYLVEPPDGMPLTVAELARFQGVSGTYLAKIFTKLTKAGLVRSSIGARGGYELARSAEAITFWDVTIAVEGGFKLFECRNVRAGCVLYEDRQEKPQWLVGGICEIHKVMQEAEVRAKEALQQKTLAAMVRDVAPKIPESEARKMVNWFRMVQKDI